MVVASSSRVLKRDEKKEEFEAYGSSKLLRDKKLLLVESLCGGRCGGWRRGQCGGWWHGWCGVVVVM